MAVGVMLGVALAALGCRKGMGPAPGMPAGQLASREAQEKGRELFMQNCVICHGQNADGQGPRSAGMIPPPANLTVPLWSDSESAPRIYRAIHDGVAGSAMPSWKNLSDDQIRNLVAYVHSLGNH
ncbi:MAG TPA: c-type cytochrome [Candidatus Binataceae bacterium]|nr:c-type cytochrome [Candidatus Binataceae bacterium]